MLVIVFCFFLTFYAGKHVSIKISKEHLVSKLEKRKNIPEKLTEIFSFLIKVETFFKSI